MIEKVLVIAYKMEKKTPLFFLGTRPKTKIMQPPTGHREQEDKTIAQTVTREIKEELGVEDFRNFINLKEHFTWIRDGEGVVEHVFALELPDNKISLEKKEFTSYEFLPMEKAVKKVVFDSHAKFIKKIFRKITEGDYNKIFVIAGPGGSGKGTIINGMIEEHGDIVEIAATATTRPRRPGEKTKYRIFLSEKDFNSLYDSGKLIEKNFFKGYWYGAPKEEISKILQRGKNVIIEIDLHGLQSFKQVFSNVVSIFIDAHVDEFKKRMTERGMETEDEIKERMRITEWELQNKHLCDYIIENKRGESEKTINKVFKIIKSKK